MLLKLLIKYPLIINNGTNIKYVKKNQYYECGLSLPRPQYICAYDDTISYRINQQNTGRILVFYKMFLFYLSKSSERHL